MQQVPKHKQVLYCELCTGDHPTCCCPVVDVEVNFIDNGNIKPTTTQIPIKDGDKMQTIQQVTVIPKLKPSELQTNFFSARQNFKIGGYSK